MICNTMNAFDDQLRKLIIHKKRMGYNYIYGERGWGSGGGGSGVILYESAAKRLSLTLIGIGTFSSVA